MAVQPEAIEPTRSFETTLRDHASRPRFETTRVETTLRDHASRPRFETIRVETIRVETTRVETTRVETTASRHSKGNLKPTHYDEPAQASSWQTNQGGVWQIVESHQRSRSAFAHRAPSRRGQIVAALSYEQPAVSLLKREGAIAIRRRISERAALPTHRKPSARRSRLTASAPDSPQPSAQCSRLTATPAPVFSTHRNPSASVLDSPQAQRQCSRLTATPAPATQPQAQRALRFFC